MIHAYETGGRIEELVDMKLSDIIRNGSMHFRSGSMENKTRYNPLPGEVIPHLGAYLAEFHPEGKNQDYLFYTIHNGQHTQITENGKFISFNLCEGILKRSLFPGKAFIFMFSDTVLEWQ